MKNLLENLLNFSKEELVKELWEADTEIEKLLIDSDNLHDAREHFFYYLNSLERSYYNIYSDKRFKDMHIIEKNNAKECIRVLKNVIRTENEKLTKFSALEILFKIAKNKIDILDDISEGFLLEFIFLFKGINGESGIDKKPEMLNWIDRKSALMRSKRLDEYSLNIREHFKRYKKGTDIDILEKSSKLKKKILKYFNSNEDDWKNYLWHLKHIIKDIETLSSLVKLEDDEIEGLKFAKENNIPFQITPYYLSLFNEDGRTRFDRVIRAQVIPSKIYGANVVRSIEEHMDMDFMGEKSTSPIDCITRRYPQIVILKPFDSCPQICVYCQRNWEIKDINEAKITQDKVKKAIRWIKRNRNITEVLITGGDPLTLTNSYLDDLIGAVSKIKHIERIRIGTRALVTLPFRINDGLIDILSKYHRIGEREICIVTHFEHPMEITPDVINAVKKIKNLGIGIYNQQVFTYFNSFRYETCFLRKVLKLSGIDPYYSFNTKGKEETIDYRVPIARIEQEGKEEARLLSGIVRTDEPVFNVPKLGKSHLRAWQDHEPIMILNTGQRVYRFYPWESRIAIVDDYLYTDVSIYDYLKRLHKDGENIEEYKSIWYYF